MPSQELTIINRVSKLFFTKLMILVAISLLPTATVLSQTVATWTGGGDGASYSDAANWDIGIVPVNNGTDLYSVVIPGGVNLQFDLAGTGHEVFQFSLAATSSLIVNSGRDLSVVDGASVDGLLTTDNGIFRSPSSATLFPGGSSRIQVTGGGEVTLSATSYSHTRNASETIFSSSGTGSTLDLSSLQSLNYTTGGALRRKTISALDNGLIDLSNLQTISINAGDDDILDFTVAGGGNIDLSSLTSINPIAGNSNNAVRFHLEAGRTFSLNSLSRRRMSSSSSTMAQR